MCCRFSRHTALLLTILIAASSAHPANDEPKWIRINSAHFSVLTDAGEKRGVQADLRLEQMRAVFSDLLLKPKLHLAQPLDVIAFRSYAEYVQLAPLQQGRPVSAQSFLFAGLDRTYIVLNMADDESWNAIQHDFAHLLLDSNYPPTQPWFDEGFAEYFSSLRLDDKQGQIGADPGGFIALLGTQPWQPIPALFAEKKDKASGRLFRAQSWIVMHYLVDQNKLSETGTYFGLVQTQGVPVEQAIEKAFSMTAAQLEQAVKEHWRSLQTPSQKPSQGVALPAGAHSFIPIGTNEIGSSNVQVKLLSAKALVAEAMLRPPEHREEALKELNALIDDPLSESAIAHRGVGWASLEKQEFDDAGEELNKALELEPNDPWTHYYLARMKFEIARSKGTLFPGLANMQQDMRIVLDWDLDFAEAYRMLAMARVEGGGINSAIDAIKAAVQLNPRNENYILDMARVYMAGKKWDAASGLLEHLASSDDKKIAEAARQNLADLPTLKKYGLLPQHGPAKAPAPVVASDGPDEADRAAQPAAKSEPDKRKIQFAKGKLVAVDCSGSPRAVLTVVAAGRTLKLTTADFKSLLLLGEDSFSCDWKNRAVFVNYKASGKAAGDLVSLELE